MVRTYSSSFPVHKVSHTMLSQQYLYFGAQGVEDGLLLGTTISSPRTTLSSPSSQSGEQTMPIWNSEDAGLFSPS
jgi:hypothetical protein